MLYFSCYMRGAYHSRCCPGYGGVGSEEGGRNIRRLRASFESEPEFTGGRVVETLHMVC